MRAYVYMSIPYRTQCGIALRRRGLRASALAPAVVINILNMPTGTGITLPTEARDGVLRSSQVSPAERSHFAEKSFFLNSDFIL